MRGLNEINTPCSNDHATKAPWATNNASAEQTNGASTDFAKALIFLTLGFAIGWCALNNWGPGQKLMLSSGLVGVGLGARYLARYQKAILGQ